MLEFEMKRQRIAASEVCSPERKQRRLNNNNSKLTPRRPTYSSKHANIVFSEDEDDEEDEEDKD